MAGPDDSTWEGIFAKNPFPKDDPRHDEAVDDLLKVKEQLDLFDSGALDKRPPEEAPVEHHIAYLVGLHVGRFDILACGLSNRVPLTYQRALEHEQDLDKVATTILSLADTLPFSVLPKETIIRELKVQLECRKKYWTGQVLKQVREAKEVRQAQEARAAVSPQADASHALASMESPKGHEQKINPAPEPELKIDPALVENAHVALLLKIVAKKNVSIDTWARDHKLSRTIVFDWKAAREAGKSLKGKVSNPKSAEIEKAIEDDAKALGLATRTRSD